MPRRTAATPQSNELAPSRSTAVAANIPALALTDAERSGLAVLDTIHREVNLQAFSSLASEAERSIVLAKAVKYVEEALTPFKEHIESLKGKPLGFKLDKIEDYDWPLTRRIVAEALLKGARITGNEFNGIAKQCYLTKEYFVRKVKSWPGLVVSEEMFGVPRQLNGQTVVDYKIICSITNEATPPVTTTVEYSREGPQAIPVRVNNGMGPDAILGKAKRKAYAGLLEKLINLSGQEWSPGNDGDTSDAGDGDARPARQIPGTATPARRINVIEWNARITAAFNLPQPEQLQSLTGLGRELVDAAGVRDGMWTQQDAQDFEEVFTVWVTNRLMASTTPAHVQSVQVTLESINNLRRLNSLNQLQLMVDSHYRRVQAYPAPGGNV